MKKAFQIASVIAVLLAASVLYPYVSAPTSVGRIVSVIDGDTVQLRDTSGREHRIRLVGLDAPEKDQWWGDEATRALVQKVAGQDVTVRSHGTDSYGRLLARLHTHERNINQEMVAEGHAWVYRRFMTNPLWLLDELRARSAGAGLWAQVQPVAPWDWRQGVREERVPHRTSPVDTARCVFKRSCREMRDCAEAEFYLRECGLYRLDGDHDGVPCESLCR